MNFILIWLSLHRIAFVIVLAIAMWVGAYGYYFRQAFAGYVQKGRPHSWSVDLTSKTAISRGKQQH